MYRWLNLALQSDIQIKEISSDEEFPVLHMDMNKRTQNIKKFLEKN